MAYYNERNGWVDNGAPLDSKNTKCPNCNKHAYIETLSREYCSNCGLECNYWGGGANEVYESMMARNHARLVQEREDRIKRQLNEEWGDDYDY